MPAAVNAYSQANNLSHEAAFNNLGEIYRDGQHFERDLPNALDLFKSGQTLGPLRAGHAHQRTRASGYFRSKAGDFPLSQRFQMSDPCRRRLWTAPAFLML